MNIHERVGGWGLPLDSLVVRTALLMGGVALLALVSMVGALIIAEATHGSAAAVNVAGSLRMQSYRIISRLSNFQDLPPQAHRALVEAEIEAFETRLLSPPLADEIPTQADNRTHQLFGQLVATWREAVRPTLADWKRRRAPLDNQQIHQIDTFVQQIDDLVNQLEADAEADIARLRNVQLAALLLTLLLVAIMVRQTQTSVVAPLWNLVEVASRIRRRDFAARARHLGHDELGQLGHALNQAAADLAALYSDLEQRVEAKTEALRISNQSLQILYDTSRCLNESSPDAAAFRRLLKEIEAFTGVGSSTLCIREPKADCCSQTVALRVEAKPRFCGWPDCGECVKWCATHRLPGQPQTLSIPVVDRGESFGVLLVNDPPWQADDGWQVALLEAVAQHIAIALRAQQQIERDRRLALLEERSVIARELHDSLAQSLSYLKIQVALLQTRLAPLGNTAANTIVADLEAGLGAAYQQLRELLTTFRLKMKGVDLGRTLEETAQEFAERGQLGVRLRFAPGTLSLSPNEEIHILQIVREALTNAVRHAQAQQVQVAVTKEGEQLRVCIDDDGVGIPDEARRDRHYGLDIMAERSHRLGGEVIIARRPEGGTRVEVCFTPSAVARWEGALHHA